MIENTARKTSLRPKYATTMPKITTISLHPATLHFCVGPNSLSPKVQDGISPTTLCSAPANIRG